MANGDGNGYPSMQVIVTFVVRALVGLFVLVLGWNVRSVVQDVQELQASDRTQDRQITLCRWSAARTPRSWMISMRSLRPSEQCSSPERSE